MQRVEIHSPYITLGQLLKKIDLIGTGGEAKHFLQNYTVKVNQQPETRRGRKIYPHDQIEIEGYGYVRVYTQSE